MKKVSQELLLSDLELGIREAAYMDTNMVNGDLVVSIEGIEGAAKKIMALIEDKEEAIEEAENDKKDVVAAH